MLHVNVNGKIIVSLMVVLNLFLTACGDDIDYIGDTYSPTSHVDVYFSEDDVSENYQQMGHATAEGGTAEELQERLIEKARENGADGIIFEEIDRVKTGETTTVDAVGNEHTLNTRVLQVKAIFIKYKKNL